MKKILVNSCSECPYSDFLIIKKEKNSRIIGEMIYYCEHHLVDTEKEKEYVKDKEICKSCPLDEGEFEIVQNGKITFDKCSKNDLKNLYEFSLLIEDDCPNRSKEGYGCRGSNFKDCIICWQDALKKKLEEKNNE